MTLANVKRFRRQGTSFLARLSSKILSLKADTCLGFRLAPAPPPRASGGNERAGAAPPSCLTPPLESSSPWPILETCRYPPSAAATSAEEDLLGVEVESPRLLSNLRGRRKEPIGGKTVEGAGTAPSPLVRSPLSLYSRFGVSRSTAGLTVFVGTDENAAMFTECSNVGSGSCG